ncbi:hypothetical protein ACFQ10_10770 [Streptomyces indonesiensis]
MDDADRGVRRGRCGRHRHQRECGGRGQYQSAYAVSHTPGCEGRREEEW